MRTLLRILGSESGWGLSIARVGEALFAVWFTYDDQGRQMWLIAPDARLTSPGTYSGRLYRTTGPSFAAQPWDPARVSTIEVGSATLAFTDNDNGTFSSTVSGLSQVRPIARMR